MWGIPLGLVAAGALEWSFHRYVQHGFGRKKGSFWDFHWREHHRVVRQNDYHDPGYHRPLGWHAQGKEVAALAAGALAVTPLYVVAPFFTATLHYSALRYYRIHKRSHLDPAWAKQNIPWHYDHHMGPNPNANWCITSPWFDHLMGTRQPFLRVKAER